MTELAVTPPRKLKIRESDFVQAVTIKRVGKPPIRLPIDEHSDRAYLQLSAAEFSAILSDYLQNVADEKIQTRELTPLQLKQIAECKKIEAELHTAAWGISSGGGKGGDGSDMDLIAQAVSAGAKLAGRRPKREGG